MSGTSVPTVQFTDRGFVPPAESAIVTGLEADFSAAFDGNLNPDPSTPQGQLITSEAAIIGDANDQEVALFNGVDPAYASGRMQDGIARIYFLERNPAQSTVVEVSCGGDNGVVIPVGALVADTDSGEVYICTQRGVIGISGTVTVSFAAQNTGPLPVPLTVKIYQAIPLWDTATVVSGAVGNLVETRAAFEARREATVAANGLGTLNAIAGAVAKVPGVIDYYATENPTGSAVVTGGFSLAAHSLYVAVAGGASADIAYAIWSKKNPGCNYNGNTTVAVSDTNSGYSFPYPSYNVTYEVPAAEAFCFQVTMANSAAVPANAAALVGAEINVAFLGQDGGQRARIGSTVYASRFYAGIGALGAWAQIINLKIGCANLIAASTTAAIAALNMTVSAIANATFTGTGSGTNLTVTAVTGTIVPGYKLSGTGVPAGTTIVSQTSGTTGGAGTYVTSQATTSSTASLTAVGVLAPGQFVFGTNILAGTYIVSQTSGTTGSTGVYVVSQSQTIGSETMITVTPNLDDVALGIAQLPTFNPADVDIVLV